MTRHLAKRSLALAGHRTSIALEPEFWTALDAMAADRTEPLITLIAAADATRDPSISLASVLRVLVLRHLQHRSPDHDVHHPAIR